MYGSSGIFIDKLTIRHGILRRKHVNLKTSQMIFQKVVPPALVEDKLHFLNSDHEMPI